MRGFIPVFCRSKLKMTGKSCAGSWRGADAAPGATLVTSGQVIGKPQAVVTGGGIFLFVVGLDGEVYFSSRNAEKFVPTAMA